MAKQVGLTTTEVANLSIAFFRQGREAKDALELTRVAAEFAKIAAINVNDAANFLTAAINGFNLSASDATRIIDRFAALGAGAAASAQEIAIALSKVAPAAASAGVEVDTLMAFVTKGIETTREAPENIGTAFKTIFARMRQLTDIGTTIEDGVNVNRVEDSLKSIGVELRDANGFFRDLDDVLIDVGQRWNSINRNQQAYVATTLAGTRQQTRLIALFEDFDRTLDLIEISQSSAGAAAIQHAEFMTGLEAATTRLRTSFQQLITSFVNSDVVIGAINAINTVLEIMNTFLGKTVLTVATLLTSFQLLTKSTKVQEFFGGIFKAITSEKADEAIAGYFAPLTKSANAMFGVFKYGVEKSGKIFPLMGQYFKTMFTNGFHPIEATRKAYDKLLSSLLNTSFGQTILIPLWHTLTGATKANTKATTANTAAASVNPYVLLAVAIAAVIVGLILLVKKIRDADGTTSKLVSA
jgi:TP901 family phage tail tape measure protein